MEKLSNEIDEIINDNSVYTPETIAWKLIMEKVGDNLESQLMTYSTESDEEGDPISFFYEILITIFMEMLFDLAIINNAFECDVNNKEFDKDNINFDIEKFDLNLFISKITECFAQISIVVSVGVFDEQNEYSQKELSDKRYCRIILRPNKKEVNLFDMYDVPDEKNYYFLGNPKYKKTDNLNNIFSTCTLNNKIYKISFYKIQK